MISNVGASCSTTLILDGPLLWYRLTDTIKICLIVLYMAHNRGNFTE